MENPQKLEASYYVKGRVVNDVGKSNVFDLLSWVDENGFYICHRCHRFNFQMAHYMRCTPYAVPLMLEVSKNNANRERG